MEVFDEEEMRLPNSRREGDGGITVTFGTKELSLPHNFGKTVTSCVRLTFVPDSRIPIPDVMTVTWYGVNATT
jgi:hypothetical protein